MTTRIEDTGLPRTVTDEGPGQRFALFCWKYVRHTKGRWAGQRFVLEPFQRAFADELFRTGPDGKRLYKEAILGIPRKNGKSMFAAALALYLLIADGESGPEVYVAAASKKQARVVFDEDRKYVRRSPGLQDFVRPYRDTIVCADNDGKLEVVSADAPLQHGLNPSGNVIDELHAHPDADLYDALTSGSGAREEPLTVGISTSGNTGVGPLWDIYTKMMERSDVERPTPYLTIVRDIAHKVLFWWYEVPRSAAIKDLAAWKGANPASWISPEGLAEERDKPTMRQSSFRRLHGNQWTSAEDEWIPPEDWEACRFGALSSNPLAGLDPALPVFVAIDVGIRHDYSVVTLMQWQDRPGSPTRPARRLVERNVYWRNPYPEDHREHDEWELDIGLIRKALRGIFAAFPVPAAKNAQTKMPHPGPAFVFDPAKFKESAQILAGEGLHMIEFLQYDRYMIPACNYFFELVKTRRIEHNGDPVLAEHVGNAVAVEREAGFRIEKPKKARRKHIDAAVTSVMAASQAQIPTPLIGPAPARPVYGS